MKAITTKPRQASHSTKLLGKYPFNTQKHFKAEEQWNLGPDPKAAGNGFDHW